MNYQSFDELLSLDVSCAVATVGDAAVLIVGDRASDLGKQLRATGAVVQDMRVRVLFGLSILTAPFPLFVGGLMTEHNTKLDRLSLFGWIEDNTIEQPRAEVFGLTPFAEQPVLFLRDFDMDRPIEAWFQTTQPSRWVRVAGVAVASSQASGDVQLLSGDEAALVAMEAALPADAQSLVTAMRLEAARGQGLRSILRQLRKSADAKVMRVLDGWRVLALAAQVVRVNPSPERETRVADVMKIAPPKRW